jgi:hypothetical protein
MQHHRTTSAVVVAGLLALGTGQAALAEGNGSSADTGSSAEQQAGVSDEKLQKFTLAMADVRKVRMEYGPKLQQAESEQKRTQLKKEGQQEMVRAIRESGLEVKEYNRIGDRLRDDKELQQRVRQMMNQQSG